MRAASAPIVAVLGEALVDLDVSTGAARAGGSPLNVAVGLARLGLATTFLARVSRDEHGALLREHANTSGVDLSHAVDAAEPSTLARVRLDRHGVAQYEFTVDGTADFAWTDAELENVPRSVRLVHFGSLASWLPPGAAAVDRRVTALHSAGEVLISYDPNVRPQLQPDVAAARAQVERSLRHAHVVKASEEDVRYLYGDVPLEEVAQDWHALGPALVVLTRGERGPLAAFGDATVRGRSHPVDVVDTVGAGDAFSSGLLDALVRRPITSPRALAGLTDLAAVLDEASLVAAITCERAGADPPTRVELRNRTETQAR